MSGALRRRTRGQHVAALGLYALLIVLAYLPVVGLGRTLQPAFYGAHGTTEPGAAITGRRPVHTFDVDIATPALYEWPINRLVGRLWRSGEVPLWNPHQGAGAPLAAQFSSRVFFPYQVLENVLPIQASDLFLLGRAWLAGFFTWLFLRRAGASAPSAFFGGMLYMFSGTWSWFGNLEQLANVALVTPLLFFSLEGLIAGGRLGNLVSTALSTALLLLGGQPEVALFVLALGGAWVVSRLYFAAGNDLRPPARIMAGCVGACLLGVALASPLLLPFHDFASRAFHLHPPGGRMGVQAPTPWAFLAGIWTPALFGHPAANVHYPDNGHWDYLGGYSGVLAWVVVLAAVVAGQGPGWRVVFFFAAAGAVLLKNLGVPPVSWLGVLPLLDQAWSPRWAGPCWTFSLAAAAGLAGDRLSPCGEEPEQERRWMQTMARVAVVFVVVVAVYAYLAHYLGRTESIPGEAFYRRALAQAREPAGFVRDVVGIVVSLSTLALAILVLRRRLAASTRITTLTALGFAELWFFIPRGYSLGWFIAQLVPWGFATLAALASLHARPRLAASAFAALAVTFVVVDVTAPRGLPERGDPYDAPAYIRFLRARTGLDRVMGLGGVFHPNQASALGLYDVRYIYALAPAHYQHLYVSLLRSVPPFRYHALWFTGTLDPFPHDRFTWDVRPHLPIYSLLGVRYFVAPNTWPFPLDLPKAYEGEVTIYENPGATPRARVVHAVERVSAVEEALRRLGRPSHDPRTTAVVVGSGNGVTDGRSSHPGTAAITHYGPARVVVRTQTDRPGLLVLTDTWDEGWRAWIGDQPTRIELADSAFRGVWVPPGEHEVTFEYDPQSFRMGVILAAGALLVCVVLLLAGWFESAPQSRKAGSVTAPRAIPGAMSR